MNQKSNEMMLETICDDSS